MYKKQKFIHLLSVKLLLPITTLFLSVMAITGITIALVLKNFSLGGLFAGLGLSVSIVSLVYILVSAEDDYVFKRKSKYLSEEMEKVKDENLFETQIYNEVQTIIQQKENCEQIKNLVQELTEKLKQQELSNKEIEQLNQHKLNLLKQKALIKQQEKELLSQERQFINKNRKLQKLNPGLDVEYCGCDNNCNIESFKG